MAGGGYFGAGFAQGLGGALAQLPQILQQRDIRLAQQEEMKLRQQEMKLKQKILENKVNQLAAQPEILKQFGEWMQGGPGAVDQTGGITPPQAPGLQGLMVGGEAPGAPAAPAAAATPTPTAPPVAMPGTMPGVPQATGAALPEIRTMQPSITVMADGEIRRTFNGNIIPYKFDKELIDLGGGNYQMVETTTNPVNGQIMNRRPIGPPAPGEKIQNAAEMIESFGLPRGTPIFKELTGQMVYALSLPGKEGTEAAQMVREMAEAAKSQMQAQGADFSKLSERVQAKEAKAAGAETAARQAAENAGRPLSSEQQQKMGGMKALERSLKIVDSNYDPAFVGKGFAQFGQDVKTSIEDGEKQARKGSFGGLGGAVRTFTGDITPKEVAFRKAVVNASNQLLYALSGQQINEAEYKRLKAALFGLTDEPVVFKAGLQGAIAETGAKIDDMLTTASTPAAELRKQRAKPFTVDIPAAKVGEAKQLIQRILSSGGTEEDARKALEELYTR